ncbi:MAG: hypothetical protein J6B29_05140 [Clostridia bacterium]|nr:hypothetical protein [Clostridia bacterium]
MKKLLFLVFTLIAVTGLVFAISASAVDASSQSEDVCETCVWIFTGYDENDMPACGVKGGTENYECLVCKSTKQVYQEAMHAFDCNMGPIEGKGPTCTEPGYAKFECRGCVEYVERLVPAQHSYEQDYSTYLAPTCTETGSVKNVCSVCGDEYVEVIPANGHNQKWQYDSTTATCTEAGVETYSCWNCTDKIEVEVDAYGHEWNVDDSSLNLEAHTINRVCATCETVEQLSSLGMEADPITTTVPGTIEVSVIDWVYYAFEHVEGYITFTFDVTDINVLVKDTTGTYTTQYFWGGNTTWTAELMESGSYVFAISSASDALVDVTVTTEMEATDVPEYGEVAEKPIVMDGVGYGYTSTGKVWYTIETPSAGTVTINVEGTATVSYGTDATALTVYTAPFVDEYGWTTYYILVESEEEVTIVVNVEAPKGTTDNPYDLTIGENVIDVDKDSWFRLPINSAGTYTFTVESADVSFGCGEAPYYQAMTFCTGETSYSFDINPMMLWDGNYYFMISEPMTLTISYQAPVIEPEEPDFEIGEVIGSIVVETTDTYTYDEDQYTYTAGEAGQYTFFVPAGLGWWNSAAMAENPYGDADVGFYDNEAGAYVTVDLEANEIYTFNIASVSKAVWTIDVYYTVAHTCEYSIVASEDSTCTVPGYIAYECECGASYVENLELAPHTEVEIPKVLPTPTVTGMTAGVKCDVCEEVLVAPVEVSVTEMANIRDPAFRIASANLVLSNSLKVNYKAALTDGYSVPHMVFVFRGVEYVVADYTIDGDKHVFTFDGSRAQFMNDNIEAYVYAETENGYSMNKILEYSVKQYCKNKFNEMPVVISDLVVMGAMTQRYINNEIADEDLITNIMAAEGITLTPTAFSSIDASKNVQKVLGDRDTGTDWKGAALTMGANTLVELKFETDSLDDLTIKVVVGGVEYFYTGDQITVDTKDANKRVVTLDFLSSVQYDEVITATFIRNGEQVGSTLTYSINSYLYRNAENTAHGENALNLMKALYVYGETMYSYFYN